MEGYGMNALKQFNRQSVWIGLGALVVMLAGCAGMGAVTLSGDQQNPPVTTSASGTSTITVAADKSVSGAVTTTGVAGTAAHIHNGAAGKNGPVVIGLTKTADNVWSVPAGAKLTDGQYEDYKAGNLYVNVHSVANKGGEIRAQLKP
jgi:hypothetical protein